MWRDAPKAYIYELGFMMALGAISTLLLGMNNDGDDEDEYMGLSAWNRYNYLNLKKGDGFVHIALPQDLRAFYAIGCISTEWAQGKIDGTEAVKSYITQANNFTPLSFVSSTTMDREPDGNPLSNVISSFVPSRFVPMYEAWVTNEDFLGRQIHNKNNWNAYEPEWQRAGYRTPDMAINASKALSKLGGGSEHKRGKWFTELNPSVAWHIADSYGGGTLDFAQKCFNLADRVLTGEEHELRDYPLVSKFYVEAGQDYSKQRVVNDRYRMYRVDYENISNELNGYLKDMKTQLAILNARASEGKISKEDRAKEAANIEKVYTDNVKRIEGYDNYWIYKLFDQYEKSYSSLESERGKARKTESDNTVDKLNGEMYGMRKELVDKIDSDRTRWIDKVRKWMD
jgi:hypothetical protein